MADHGKFLCQDKISMFPTEARLYRTETKRKAVTDPPEICTDHLSFSAIHGGNSRSRTCALEQRTSQNLSQRCQYCSLFLNVTRMDQMILKYQTAPNFWMDCPNQGWLKLFCRTARKWCSPNRDRSAHRQDSRNQSRDGKKRERNWRWDSSLEPADQSSHNFMQIQRILSFSPGLAMTMPQKHHCMSRSAFPTQKWSHDTGWSTRSVMVALAWKSHEQ
jgi:hypothetical protein